MALFKRKDSNKPSVLPEIEQYYDAEKRDRAGLAWIMAVISIVAVVALLVGLFFGGRWLYRHVTKDKNPTATVQTVSSPTKSTTKSTSDSSSSSTTPSTPTTTPATTPTPAPTTTATTPAPATAPASSTKLANTGPEGIIPAFIIATFLGALLYRFKAARN